MSQHGMSNGATAVAAWPTPSSDVGMLRVPEASVTARSQGISGKKSYTAPCAAVAIVAVISLMLYVGLPPVEPRSIRSSIPTLSPNATTVPSGAPSGSSMASASPSAAVSASTSIIPPSVSGQPSLTPSSSAIAAPSTVPPASVAEVEGQPRLSFVAIGDWGRKGNAPQKATAAQMATWAGTVSSPFILSVGDNFYNNGVSSESDSQFATSWSDVYNQPSVVGKPWYLILGNHDYRGAYLQVGWPGDQRWTLPNPFYTAVFDMASGSEIAGPRSNVSLSEVPALISNGPGQPPKPCLAMVFVDTCPWIASYRSASTAQNEPQFYSNIVNATDTAAQMAWLNESLRVAAPLCPALLVTGHHPLYTPGEHGDNPPLINSWGPLFQQYGVDAYIAGHDHTMAHLEAGGIQYVVTGAGSDTRDNSVPTPETVFLLDSTPGFTVHSMNRTHMAHTYMTADGERKFQRAVPLRPKPTAAANK